MTATWQLNVSDISVLLGIEAKLLWLYFQLAASQKEIRQSRRCSDVYMLSFKH
ncbi:hypothetical protein ACFO4O_11470 [Glaciecola siphonariae]|uniref:Uncharacterized protein n=1 Tax=Glaciecola siphonariae TaxID=521012 RepID=A0ABV9LW88_9ALTE